MNTRSLKLLLITFFLESTYFLLVSYPYFFSKITRFNSLGFFSAVDEQQSVFKLKPSKVRTTDQFDNHILAGEKVVSQFRATENNLGIILIRFQRFGKVSDRISFRLKQEGAKDWYYEHIYRADQFEDNAYFTFGFPPVIESKNKFYVFELESLAGKYNNGIGVSLHEPQVAFVYKYSRGDLTNYSRLSSFVSKKFVYVARNANFLRNWQLLATLALPLILIPFMEKKKIKVSNIVRFLPYLRKNHRKILKIIIIKIKSDYLSFERKILEFSNKLTNQFTLTKFYLRVLNTNTKKRLAIGMSIFLLAFTYRFSTSLVDQSSLFYAGLGGQGDYDQFIRAATCAVKNFCLPILHQNFLIESLILGTLYEIFGFAGGLKAYLYLMLVLSSTVATLPYILLSRKNWISVGGVIGGLFLATSDFLTRVAISFPPDNGSLFTFSMLYIVYFLTLHIGTFRWLLFFGLAGFIDGINKALFLINDPVALALFVPVFFYEKVSTKGSKILSLFQKKNMKILLLSAVPVLVFLTLYSAWEYFVYIKFSVPYFLRELIETRGGNFVLYTSFNDHSLTGGIVFQLFFVCSSIIVMVKRLIELSDVQTIFLAPIYLSLVFVTFIKQRFSVKKFIFTLVSSVSLIVLLTLVKNNYSGINAILGDYIYAWPDSSFINIFLFLGIIFLFILNFKYSAIKLFLPIAPYVVMLIILTKNSPFARLQTHVVVWNVILLAYIIDFLMTNIYKYPRKRIRILLPRLILILFISFYGLPKIATMTSQLQSGLATNQSQVRYLQWVEGELPSNSIVLAGGKNDLVMLAENVRRPIIYNSLWNAAVLINPNEPPGIKPTDFNLLNTLRINEIPGVTPSNFSIISELQNKNNFKKNKYFILEDDIFVWRARVTGMVDNVFSTTSNTLQGNDYSIKVYKYNPTLKKAIYELNIRENKSIN